MNSRTKQIVIGSLYVSLLFAFVLIFRPVYFNTILQKFSNRRYLDDLTLSGQGVQYLILLAYSILSFFWTRRTLLSVKKTRLTFWIINWIIDVLILPLSVLIMVLYYNYTSVYDTKNVSSIENFFLIWFLLAIKHVSFQIAHGNIAFSKKAKHRSRQP